MFSVLLGYLIVW